MPTVKELRETAKRRGLKGYSSLLKDELIKFLDDNPSPKKQTNKSPCPEGKEINPKTGRCVKICEKR